MIKPVNLFVIAILSLSAAGLFQIKFYVQNLIKDKIELLKYINEEKQSIHVLKAEWAYLNQPERLKNIIENHLTLEIVNINQIHKMIDNLPIKLAENSKEIIEKEENIIVNNIPKFILKNKDTENIKIVKNKTHIQKKIKSKFAKVKF